MIAFDLNCNSGHRFEGWFTSSADFDLQLSNGLLCCPMCGDVTVQKALSVPNVPRKTNQRTVSLPPGPTPAAVPMSASPPPAVTPAHMVELMQKLAVAQTEMLNKSHWVGGNFAETARAIHYGEEPERMIHGETSTEEAKSLFEEGVSVAPLLFPVVPPTAKN